VFDAMRFSNTAINGSARYMGMAGSFGAIGGDISAAIDNPATLGIFRSSEASVSLAITPTIAKSDWFGAKYSQNFTSFTLNNLAWVFNIPSNKESGYLATNLSFGYHKIKDFNRKIYMQSNSNSVVSLTDLMANSLNRDDRNMIFEDDLLNEGAYNDARLDWLSILGYDAFLVNPIYENEKHIGQWTSFLNNNENILPNYLATERGSIGEYNFTYSGNVNDLFYLGAGISYQTVMYNIDAVYSEFYPVHEDYFDLNNIFEAKGGGVNIKLGTLIRATNWLRLGLSFQTPTWYWLRDYHYANLKYSGNEKSVGTPEIDYIYTFSTPIKVQASVGFVLGKCVAINVDYQFSNKKYLLKDDYMKNYESIDYNNDAKFTHIIKFGAEVRLGKYFKIRGGGAFITAPIEQDAFKYYPYYTTRTDTEYFVSKNSYYGTSGLGYAKNNISIDLAYAYYRQNHDFFAAENFRPTADFTGSGTKLKTHSHNIVATIAFRY
jgi:hypothetical protein